MKRFLSSLIALIALAAVSTARAQGYSAYSAEILLSGGTNNIAAAATNTYTTGNVMSLTRQREVGLLFSFNLQSASSSTHTILFSSSVDGTNWKTNDAGYTLSLAANGTSTVLFTTNLTVGAIGYLRLESISNTNAAIALTNLAVLYSIKR